MFKRILIANRGEIACRIIKTAQRMGIETVAVYSEVDKDALHVEMADQAVAIGPAAAAQSYLDIEKIVAASRRTGAEAVHPGYGFLSEQEGFARALASAGISSTPIRTRSRPWATRSHPKRRQRRRRYHTSRTPGVIADDAEALQSRRGDRLSDHAEGLRRRGREGHAHRPETKLKSAKASRAPARRPNRRSATTVCYREGRQRRPPHRNPGTRRPHGHLIHLGERECSIQRRNQKVIEEAPSRCSTKQPAPRWEPRLWLSPRRSAMIGRNGGIRRRPRPAVLFLEMNTRLQVEHPVTELVTGIDLVEQMIRIAAGEKLGITQADVALSGWAIEARVYAEDPLRNFLPSTGRLSKYWPPSQHSDNGVSIRVDTGVVEGGEISIWYDPLIAKLITAGPSRELALEAQIQALDAFLIRGIRHNIPFLAAIMQHPRFRQGRLATSFIAEEFPTGFHGLKPKGKLAKAMVAVATAVDHVLGERKRQISGQMLGRAVTRQRVRCVKLGNTEFMVEVLRDAHKINVRFLAAETARGRTYVLELAWKPGELLWSGLVNGERVAVQIDPMPNGFRLSHRGIAVNAMVYTEREAGSGAPDAGQSGGRHQPDAALSDAGAGRIDCGHRGSRGKNGRDPGRGRGHEDGKRAASGA